MTKFRQASGITILRRSFSDVLLQIAPGLWQLIFHFPVTTNCWLWLADDGLTLVDAANQWNTAAILSAIKHLGYPLRGIIITHAHPDHAGAAAELASLTSALVFAHQADIPYLKGEGSMADLSGFWLSRIVLKTAARLSMLNPPPVKHVVEIGDGETIGRLKILHTPGHTPGSLSVWDESHSALFCGDNISTIGGLHLGLPLFTLDLAARDESMRRYADLPAKLLLAGHGPVYQAENAAADVLRLLGR